MLTASDKGHIVDRDREIDSFGDLIADGKVEMNKEMLKTLKFSSALRHKDVCGWWRMFRIVKVNVKWI